jgi:hypothetical protein
MQNTGSFHSATRWLSCSLGLLLLAACVTQTSRYYVADPQDTRITPDEFRDAGDTLIASQCTRIMSSGTSPGGEARFRLEINSGGHVEKAHLARSSGDADVDAIFGALAARLRFVPPADGKALTHPISAGYACSQSAAAVTLDIGTPPPPSPSE